MIARRKTRMMKPGLVCHSSVSLMMSTSTCDTQKIFQQIRSGYKRPQTDQVPDEEDHVCSGVDRPHSEEYDAFELGQREARDAPVFNGEQQQQHEEALCAVVDEVADHTEQLNADAVEGELEEVDEVEEHAQTLHAHAGHEEEQEWVVALAQREHLHGHEEDVCEEECEVDLDHVERLEAELVFERVQVFLVRISVDEPHVHVDRDVIVDSVPAAVGRTVLHSMRAAGQADVPKPKVGEIKKY